MQRFEDAIVRCGGCQRKSLSAIRWVLISNTLEKLLRTSDENVTLLPFEVPEHGGNRQACIEHQDDLVRLGTDELREALAGAHEKALVDQSIELVGVALHQRGERLGGFAHGVGERPVCSCGEMSVSVSDNRYRRIRIDRDRLWIVDQEPAGSGRALKLGPAGTSGTLLAPG